MARQHAAQHYKQRLSDAASVIPDTSSKKILMGFWHNWPSDSGQGYQQGRFAEMELTDIPEDYNVVAVAFMKGSGIPTFKPYNVPDAEFRRQIGVLNSQGRAVLISLGGADAHIELYEGQQNALADEIIRLVDVYGFDGLDIDLEQAAIDAADNQTVIPSALRRVKQHYAGEGKNFIISMAPEFPYLRTTGNYLPYIEALKDIYDFIAPQFYNQGGDGVDVPGHGWIGQNNDALKKEFLYYLTDSLIHGTRGYTQIPAEKFAIGLPTNVDAAATGYVIDPQDVIYALDRFESDGNPIKGLMTWSVSWDNGVNRSGVPYNWEFARRYGFITEEDGGGSEKPTAPKNLISPSQTQNSITLTWQASTGVNPIAHYSVYRDGQPVSEPNSTTFTDGGLEAGKQYNYYVTATDNKGNISAGSATLAVSTQPGAAQPWRENKWYVADETVVHQNATYLCIQQHTSNKYWLPNLATMLWQAQTRRLTASKQRSHR